MEKGYEDNYSDYENQSNFGRWESRGYEKDIKLRKNSEITDISQQHKFGHFPINIVKEISYNDDIHRGNYCSKPNNLELHTSKNEDK
jgi:hypothetical protein